jgi:hypothetical protein
MKTTVHWLKHSSTSSTTGEAREIVASMGAAAGYAYWCIQEYMADSGGYLPPKAIKVMAPIWGVRPGRVEEMLSAFPDIFISTSEGYTTSLVQDALKVFQRNVAKSTLAVNTRWGNVEVGKLADSQYQVDTTSIPQVYVENTTSSVDKIREEEIKTNTCLSPTASGCMKGKLFGEEELPSNQHELKASIDTPAAAPAAENVSGDTRVQAAEESVVKAPKKASPRVSKEAGLTLEERRAAFVEDVWVTARAKGKYPAVMIEEFIDKWAESDGKKMRCEMEKTFEIPRRLSTWQKNNFRGNCYFPTVTSPAPSKEDVTAIAAHEAKEKACQEALAAANVAEAKEFLSKVA